MLQHVAQQVMGELEEAPDLLADPNYLLQAPEVDNLAEHLDSDVLGKMGTRAVAEYDIDKNSRSDWEKRIETAIKLATQVAEKKSFPWEGAANVVFPLLTSSAMQFAARAYGAIVQGRDVVKGQVIGEDEGVPQVGIDPETGQPAQVGWEIEPGAKQEKADRIGQHMSWQLTEEMPEWEEDTDRLLHILPIVGVCFRKVYWSPVLQRNCSHLVTADKLIVNYWAKSLETAPRVTEEIELYPLEVTERMRSGVFLDIELGTAADSDNDEDAPHLFLEQHRRWDLDDDGYPEPYIVTVHKETSKVVRVVANWDAETVMVSPMGMVQRIEPVQYYVKYGFIPSVDGSFYETGFGVLLDAINATVNTTINQLMDAGTRQNVGGGFIGAGLNLGKEGTLKFKLGEYKVVQASGQDIRANIVDLPGHGPSPVLFQLLGMLIEAAKDITAVQDVLTGDQQPANTPATTTLALIEQGLKVFTSIYKRIHRSLKKELSLLRDLNRKYLSEQVYFRVLDAPMQVSLDDYNSDDFDVVPVSDPTIVTDMQLLGRAQFIQSLLPSGLIDPQEAMKRILRAAKIENPDALLVQPPDPMQTPQAVAMIEEHMGKMALLRAQIVETTSRAVLNVANAEKAEVGANMDAYRAEIERIEAIAGIRQQATEGEDGTGEGRVPSVAPGPDDTQGLAVPPGRTGDAEGGMGAIPIPGPGSLDAAGGAGLDAAGIAQPVV